MSQETPVNHTAGSLPPEHAPWGTNRGSGGNAGLDIWLARILDYPDDRGLRDLGRGVWLFYIQHQFEGVTWERMEDWDFTHAVLQGSSYYRLSRILQQFSGNIEFHHIHHLSPHIPNYELEDCHKANPLFHSVPPITLGTSLKSLNFHLWDEESRKSVGFGHLKQIRRQQKTVAS